MSNFHGIQAKKDRQRTANAVAGANDAVEGTDPIPPQQPQPQPQQQQLTSTSPSLVNVSVPASSLTTALDAVASAGIPLAGSTIRLQLDGSGFDSAITHLQVSPSESARSALTRVECICSRANLELMSILPN